MQRTTEPGKPGWMSRRGLIGAGFAAAAATTVDGWGLEPRRLDLVRHDVLVPGLPPALAGLRIAQVSDVHLPGTPETAELAAAAIERERPEVVVLTGDMVEQAGALPALAELGPRLRGTVGTFAVFGNWEYKARISPRTATAVYGRAGIEFLLDQGAAVTIGGSRLGFLGFDDALYGNPSLPRALAARAPADVEIWLIHAPEYFDILLARGASPSLVLAGHTHGGQIRLPGLTPYTPPGSADYVSGWYRTGSSRLYVSRGIGTATIRARLFCPPELPIFTLRRA